MLQCKPLLFASSTSMYGFNPAIGRINLVLCVKAQNMLTGLHTAALP
jgi:hypothetical protein